MRIQSAGTTVSRSPALDTIRLLLPVDATERSRWGVHYALNLRTQGRAVEAVMLHVAEPVRDWRVLRFKTQEEMSRFHAERGQWLMEDACAALVQAQVPVDLQFREGEIVFEILDAAEQLDCSQIVLPVPGSRWVKLISRDVVREALRRQRTVPVVTVNAEGVPVQLWQH